MERPNAATIAWYDAAVPEDPRAVKGQMFGHPCAFVNRNMFFGTFGQSVVVRVGDERAAALAKKGPGRIFEPMPGRAWREYLQLERGAVSARVLAGLATDALEHTASLPPKAAKTAAKTAAKKAPRKAPGVAAKPKGRAKPAKRRR